MYYKINGNNKLFDINNIIIISYNLTTYNLYLTEIIYSLSLFISTI